MVCCAAGRRTRCGRGRRWARRWRRRWCAAGGAAARSGDPATATAAAPAGATVALTRVVFDLPAGARYETRQAGLLCVTQRTLTWKGAPVVFEAAPYRRAFRAALLAQGVQAQGDATELFEAETAPAALSVGALVTALHARACVVKGFGPLDGAAKGEAHMAVEWQVYDHAARAVVVRLRTEADYALPPGAKGEGGGLIPGALAANAAILAQDAGFRRAAGLPAPAPATATATPPPPP